MEFRPFYFQEYKVSSKVMNRNSFSNWEELSLYYYSNKSYAKNLAEINPEKSLKKGEWILLFDK